MNEENSFEIDNSRNGLDYFQDDTINKNYARASSMNSSRHQFQSNIGFNIE